MYLLTSSTVVLWTLYNVNGFLLDKTLTAVEGQNVRLTCNRREYVAEAVDWKYARAPDVLELDIWADGHFYNDYQHKCRLDVTDYTLTILNVTRNDTGRYYCQENKGLGERHFVYLKVELVRLRLSRGDVPNEGRLEISYNDTWGTVCLDDFEDVDASVACISLGYSAGEGKALHNKYGPGIKSMPIWLDDVNCFGSEEFIGHCRHKGWNVSDCDHQRDVSIACFVKQLDTPTFPNGQGVNITIVAIAVVIPFIVLCVVTVVLIVKRKDVLAFMRSATNDEPPIKANDTGDHPTDASRKEENVECHLMSTASH